MAYPVYYVEAGDTLPHLFDSFDGGTGASITMTNLAVADIKIYKDGSATQRSSTAGFTLLDTDGIDFDTITGIHGFSIDLSDNTDAGFYAVGSWYHVVVDNITIDAQTVSFVACAFRIVSATRGMAGTALPDAAADAAGGVPISDAGALDLDAKIGALTYTVAGDVDVNVQSIAGAAVNTAAAQLGVNTVSLTANAITAAAIADAAIDAATFAAGAINAAAIADAAIDAATFAAGAINAAAIANGAIDAATFAADMDAEIATIVWNAAVASYGGAGTYGQAVEDVLDDTGTAGVVVAAASKTGYALSDAGVDAVFDRASSVTLSFEALLIRCYEMIGDKMTVNEATGAVALRNIGDTVTLATGSVISDSGTTTRAELIWA